MENRSRIGITLIICGTVCIVTALGLVAFFAYLLAHATPPPGGAEPFLVGGGFPAVLLMLTLLCGLTGIAFVVVGVVVGLRQSSQTNRTPSSPP